MPRAPRAVVVHRRTELDELTDRHGTRRQAEFFLHTRGRNLAEIRDRHEACAAALQHVAAVIPTDWRRGTVERADLGRFLFDPDDLVIVVGQDGLVANVAKYLTGQPVVGFNPEPHRNSGALVKHHVADADAVLAALATGSAPFESRTLAHATTDDGQSLSALNEIYLGDPGHQSTRYRITEPDGTSEHQSSSGLIVATGTGATGWCASIARERRNRLTLPRPDGNSLAWFVREAWPSPVTGTTCTEGVLAAGDQLLITVESDRFVMFGDGLETDRVTAGYGQDVSVGVDPHALRLVTG